MFVELVFASVLAAGGQAAADTIPQPEPAVIRDADAHTPARLQFAADLGCPRHYDRRGRRCYRRHADPYHDNRGPRYGRYSDERYLDDDGGPYARRGDRYDSGSGYREDPRRPRDTLRDRRGRPYLGDEPDINEDAPRYRSGAYDRPDPRDPRYNAPVRPDRGGEFRTFRDAPAPDYRRPLYDRSSYRGPVEKKKDTRDMTVIATLNRTAGYAAGSTA